MWDRRIPSPVRNPSLRAPGVCRAAKNPARARSGPARHEHRVGLFGVPDCQELLPYGLLRQHTRDVRQSPDVEQLLRLRDHQQDDDVRRLPVDRLELETGLPTDDSHHADDLGHVVHGRMGNGDPVLHAGRHRPLPRDDRLTDDAFEVRIQPPLLHEVVDEIVDRLPLVVGVEPQHEIGRLEKLARSHGVEDSDGSPGPRRRNEVPAEEGDNGAVIPET